MVDYVFRFVGPIAETRGLGRAEGLSRDGLVPCRMLE